MIEKDRMNQLRWNWENESDAESEEWREDLSPEEEELVEKWDNQYESGFIALAEKILAADRRREEQRSAAHAAAQQARDQGAR